MNDAQTNTQGNTTWWITSLAISVVCCAILFVVFAGYLFGFREKLLIVETKLSMIEQRNAQLSMEIDNLHRRTPIQQIQVIPPNAAPQYMLQNAQPSSLAPAEAGKGEEGAPTTGVPARPVKTNMNEQGSGTGNAGETTHPAQGVPPEQSTPPTREGAVSPVAPHAGQPAQMPSAATK